MKVSKPAALHFEANFTWAACIKTTGDGTIIARGPATGNWIQGGKALFVINGILRFDVGWVGNTSSAMKVSDGEWRHVALATTFQTSNLNDGAVMYIDGREVQARSDVDVNKLPEAGLVAVRFMALTGQYSSCMEQYVSQDIRSTTLYSKERERVESITDRYGAAGTACGCYSTNRHFLVPTHHLDGNIARVLPVPECRKRVTTRKTNTTAMALAQATLIPGPLAVRVVKADAIEDSSRPSATTRPPRWGSAEGVVLEGVPLRNGPDGSRTSAWAGESERLP